MNSKTILIGVIDVKLAESIKAELVGNMFDKINVGNTQVAAHQDGMDVICKDEAFGLFNCGDRFIFDSISNGQKGQLSFINNLLTMSGSIPDVMLPELLKDSVWATERISQ